MEIMRRSTKFCQRGSNFDRVFLLMRGERTQIRQYAGQHWLAKEMQLRWRADDGPTLNAGLVVLCFFRGFGPVLLYFYDFSGLSGPPVSPSGFTHGNRQTIEEIYICKPSQPCNNKLDPINSSHLVSVYSLMLQTKHYRS